MINIFQKIKPLNYAVVISEERIKKFDYYNRLYSLLFSGDDRNYLLKHRVRTHVPHYYMRFRRVYVNKGRKKVRRLRDYPREYMLYELNDIEVKTFRQLLREGKFNKVLEIPEGRVYELKDKEFRRK